MIMREYSMRFLIAMILGICVLLLFITGRSDQTAIGGEPAHSFLEEDQKIDKNN